MKALFLRDINTGELQKNTHTHTHTRKNMGGHTYEYVLLVVCVCACVHLCIYVCMCVCVYACMHTCPVCMSGGIVPAGRLSVGAWAGLAVVMATSAGISKVARATLIALRTFCVVLAALWGRRTHCSFFPMKSSQLGAVEATCCRSSDHTARV